MRPDRTRQLARAAALAGRSLSRLEPQKSATAIAARVAPAIAQAIAAELAEVRSERQRPDDRKLLKACQDVGRAVDRLEQLRFAGAREASARVALENAARRLAHLIRERGGRAHV